MHYKLFFVLALTCITVASCNKDLEPISVKLYQPAPEKQDTLGYIQFTNFNTGSETTYYVQSSSAYYDSWDDINIYTFNMFDKSTLTFKANSNEAVELNRKYNVDEFAYPNSMKVSFSLYPNDYYTNYSSYYYNKDAIIVSSSYIRDMYELTLNNIVVQDPYPQPYTINGKIYLKK